MMSLSKSQPPLQANQIQIKNEETQLTKSHGPVRGTHSKKNSIASAAEKSSAANHSSGPQKKRFSPRRTASPESPVKARLSMNGSMTRDRSSSMNIREMSPPLSMKSQSSPNLPAQKYSMIIEEALNEPSKTAQQVCQELQVVYDPDRDG